MNRRVRSPTKAPAYIALRGDWQTITPPAGADVWVKKGEEKKEIATYPYVVVELEETEKNIRFE